MKSLMHLSAGNYTAAIAPNLGMALMDFRYKDIPLLDPQRAAHFDDNRKGLGPLIFPHFNQAGPSPLLPEAQCQWLPGLKKLGIKNSLQHGIGRYAAWACEQKDNAVTGRLTSKDFFLDKVIGDWIGLSFEATLTFTLDNNGLRIRFDADADKPIQAGIHYYYPLVDRSQAQVTLPSAGAENPVRFNQGWDKAFAVTDKNEVKAVLETPTHRFITSFKAGGVEGFDAIIVFSPEGTGFTCIEPVTWLDGMGVPRESIHAEIGLSAETKPPI